MLILTWELRLWTGHELRIVKPCVFCWQLMGQVKFLHGCGESLRHSSVLESGDLQSSKGGICRVQHCCGVVGFGPFDGISQPASMEQDRCCQCILGCSCELGTLLWVTCEELHRWAREEALSYAYFQNYLLSWASATDSSLGQEKWFSVE